MKSTPKTWIPNALFDENPQEHGNVPVGLCSCKSIMSSPFPTLRTAVAAGDIAGYSTDPLRSQVPLPGADYHVIPRLPSLMVDAGADSTYEWPYGLLTTGRVRNEHWHCSALKRLLSSVIAALDLDTYPLCHQEWLSHKGSGGPYVVGAFVTQTLRSNWDRFVKCGLQGLFVVEDYEEGHHHDDEYWYNCKNGRAYGRHREGDASGESWSDENLWFKKRDGSIGDGYYVATLAEFGPQRLVYIGKVQVPEHDDWEHAPTKTKPWDGTIMTTPSPLVISLELVEIKQEGLTPGYDHSPLPRIKIGWIAGIVLWLCRVFRFGWDGNALHFAEGRSRLLQVLAFPLLWALSGWLPLPVLGDMCPKYYLKGRYAREWCDFINEQTTLPYGGLSLPPGFYSVGDSWIYRVAPNHPECNYCNMLHCAEQFVTSRGMSSSSAFRVLSDIYGPSILPAVSKDNIDTPPPCPRVAVSVEYAAVVAQRDAKERICRLDPQHNDYTFAEPAAEGVAYTLEQRVLQRAGAPRDEVFGRLKKWWKERGGRSIAPALEPPDFSGYVGAKRALYERMYESFMSAAPGYNCFLKCEVLPSANIIKGKATRCIQANNKAFNVLAFNFFHEFEKQLLGMKYHGLPIFAKGKSMPERLQDIRELCARYPYTYSCDFKNFDGHNKAGSYLAEIDFFESIGLPQSIADALREAKCYGAFEAQVPMRHSGDLFTGSGNCLQAASILMWAGCEHAIYCDGDDTLIFTNDLKTVDMLTARAHLAGHELTFDAVNRHTGYGRMIPFCQQLFLEHGEHGIIPNVDRLMEKLFNVPFRSREELEQNIYGKLLAACAYGAAGIPGFPCIDLLTVEADQAQAFARFAGMVYDPETIAAVLPYHPATGMAAKCFDRIISECICPNILAPSEANDRALATHNLLVVQRVAKDLAAEVWMWHKSLSKDGSYGTLTQQLVCTLTHSQVWTSQFGSAELLLCMKPMSCKKSDFTSFRALQLSTQVSSPAPSTRTERTLRLAPLPRCSNNRAPCSAPSANVSPLSCPETSSGVRQPADSQRGANPISSTSTSGSPPNAHPPRSPSRSNTEQRSTHPKRDKRQPRRGSGTKPDLPLTKPEPKQSGPVIRSKTPTAKPKPSPSIPDKESKLPLIPEASKTQRHSPLSSEPPPECLEVPRSDKTAKSPRCPQPSPKQDSKSSVGLPQGGSNSPTLPEPSTQSTLSSMMDIVRSSSFSVNTAQPFQPRRTRPTTSHPSPTQPSADCSQRDDQIPNKRLTSRDVILMNLAQVGFSIDPTPNVPPQFALPPTLPERSARRERAPESTGSPVSRGPEVTVEA